MLKRAEHKFGGFDFSACFLCGLPFDKHRASREREDNRKNRRRGRPYVKPNYIYVGIDGEGQGRENHVYNLLAASDDSGERTWHVEDLNGLDTETCLEFITELPWNVRLYSYSFNYDLTKMLADVGNQELYELFRPELRQRFGKDAFKGPRAVPWKHWILNLQGTKFSIRRRGQSKNRVIWDIWKFFQCKFTGALRDWKVGTKDEVDRMELMKNKRHLFDLESRENVRTYCFGECRLMSELAQKLIEAHVNAEIPLKTFYGAGSSGTAMLKKMNIRDYIKEPPEEVITPVSQAFFGGRFDNSWVGTVSGLVHGYDISSAYPFEMFNLPCLTHGTWYHTKKRADIEGSTAALVRYSLPNSASVNTRLRPWGPFSFRLQDGSICSPATSGGGWVWREEFKEGERLFGNVCFREAWCYTTECACHPFKDLPHYYLERLRIGKEGAGIALKLGMNSCAGKTAQSVGNGLFRSWVWAGLINSGCRAKVLTALGLHSDWRNMIMVATDGILTRELLDLPVPKDTGTSVEVIDQSTGKPVFKPLGAWEYKPSPRGVFIARPGVYFPLDPNEDDIKTVRGRGVGRGVILENWHKIVQRWDQWDGKIRPSDVDRDDYSREGWPVIRVSNVTRFCGAKSSISRSTGKDGKFVYTRANGPHIAEPGQKPHPNYGQWMTRQVAMSFDPMPKRSGLDVDGHSLILRHLPQDVESAPYKEANISDEARQLKLMTLEENEQPDGELHDYE